MSQPVKTFLIRHAHRAGVGVLLLASCLQSQVILAATAPNSTITNTGAATYSVGANNFTVTSTVAVNTAACIDTGIKVELLQYISPTGAALAPAGTRIEAVQPAGYAALTHELPFIDGTRA